MIDQLNLLCTKRDILRDKINHSREEIGHGKRVKPHSYILPFVMSPWEIDAIIKQHETIIEKYSPQLDAIEDEILNLDADKD